MTRVREHARRTSTGRMTRVREHSREQEHEGYHQPRTHSGLPTNRYTILRDVSGVRLQVDDSHEAVTYEWHGGHTVNVMDSEGHAIDAFSVGDFSQPASAVTERDVLRGIKRRNE